jgi:hypothetical protein
MAERDKIVAPVWIRFCFKKLRIKILLWKFRIGDQKHAAILSQIRILGQVRDRISSRAKEGRYLLRQCLDRPG